MIIDPLNENNAIGDDGEIIHAVRMLPIVEGEPTPTIEELAKAPIIGYGKLSRDPEIQP